jgi:hypothetical protein
MTEDDIQVIINYPQKVRKEGIDHYNRALSDLRSTLQQFGTSNLNGALAVMVASMAVELGIDIVTTALGYPSITKITWLDDPSFKELDIPLPPPSDYNMGDLPGMPYDINEVSLNVPMPTDIQRYAEEARRVARLAGVK